ncbi:uncharacterized protein LOC144449018 [Glandiceps talaboti]
MADAIETPDKPRAMESDDSFDFESVESGSSENERVGRIDTTRRRDFNDERIDKSLSELVGTNTRRYENKAGNFVTGFDVMSEEYKSKKELRAKRFGIKKKPNEEEEMEVDLPSYSTTIEGIEIRPEALHIQGVDEMTTQDLFDYFREFQPGSIEWIDDTSCNVVWLDPHTARRALFALSKPTEKKTTTTTTTTQSTKQKEELPNEDAKQEEEEDVDDDFLDLEPNTEDKETGEVERPPVKQKPSANKIEETGEVIQEEPGEDKCCETQVFRIAVPHPKAEHLLLRQATKADKKKPGAANRSRFYIKHGNPNFGGMKGLISQSMKRKIRDGKVVPGKRKRRSGRSLVSYTDLDVFSDNSDRREDRRYDEAEGVDEEEEEENNDIEEGKKAVDSEVEEMELEVERLTRPVQKKKFRGMYADEVEQQIKQIRQQPVAPSGNLKVVVDARQRIADKMKLRLGPKVTYSDDEEIDRDMNFVVDSSRHLDRRQIEEVVSDLEVEDEEEEEQEQEVVVTPEIEGDREVLPDLRTKLINRYTSKRLLENLPSLSIEVQEDD